MCPAPAAPPSPHAQANTLYVHRFALTIKGLPHKTEWVEYPDIEALYHKLGIEAVDKHSSDGSPYYTLPVLHDPHTGTTLGDSTAIVRYLDATYPDTPALLPPESRALHAAFQTSWWRVQGAIIYVVVHPVYLVLNPHSQEFFRTTREKILGKKLEEITGEKEWAKLEEALGLVGQWLDANEEGKRDLIGADKILFADLTLAGALYWVMASFGKESDKWKRICGWHGGRWKAYVDKFEQYATIH